MRKRITAQFARLWNYLREWRQHPSQTILRVSLFVVVLVVGLNVGISRVYAFPGGSFFDFGFDTILAGISMVLFAVANFAIALTIFCLKFFIALASYNDFSNEPVVTAGWVLVRDVANMFFIVALLIIAFATVLGQENYAMKKTLGKVVLMAILINFSKLITQLILDVAHVFSMTFVNAISATAGGNVISLLKLSEIRTMANADFDSYSEIGTQLIVTGIFAIAMAGIAMFSLLTYMIVLLYRMVMLWVLIIMSPLAFAMQALPATSNYAKEWWAEFTKNVLSLPIMVIFMWLAFATLGTGTGLEGIVGSGALSADSQAVIGSGGAGNTPPLTLSDASTWSNLAGFAVVIAFLFAGLEQVQRLNVRGAGSQLRDNIRKGVLLATGATALGFAGKVASKPFVRTAGNLKNRASIAGSKATLGWDEFVGRHDLVPDMLKSGRYKDKVASDWEKAADNHKQIYSEAISTGSTNAGKEKLNSSVKRQIAEDRGKGKKAQKYAKEKKKVLEGEFGGAGSPVLMEYKAEQDTVKNDATLNQTEKAAKLKEVDAKYSRKMRYAMFTRDAHELEKESTMLNAEVKDYGQVLQGKTPKFAQAAQRGISEEELKVYEGKPDYELKALAIALQDKIKKSFTDKNESAAQASMRELEILRSAAKTTSSYHGAYVDDALAKNAGFTDRAKGGDLASQLERNNHIMTGGSNVDHAKQYVSFANSDKEMKRIRKRALVSEKKAALEGQLSSHGLSKPVVNAVTGEVEIVFKSVTHDDKNKTAAENKAANEKDMKDFKVGFEGLSKFLSAEKLDDLDSAVSSQINAKGESEAIIATKSDAEVFAQALRSVKGNTKLSPSMQASIEKLYKEANDKNRRFTETDEHGKVTDLGNIKEYLESKLSKDNIEAINKQLSGVKLKP